MSWYLDTMTPDQQEVLKMLAPSMQKNHFYLVGGTAIALWLGHRQSIDLDWFSQHTFEPMQLAQSLRRDGVPFITEQVAAGTLHGTIKGIRISLLAYDYPLLEPFATLLDITCPIASLADLACMKLVAIAQRGAKKDFIDMYAIANQYQPLKELIALYQKKYQLEDMIHVLYGLSYFDDAEKDPLPILYWSIEWSEIKSSIQSWVKELAQ